jgi:hypothetical protein
MWLGTATVKLYSNQFPFCPRDTILRPSSGYVSSEGQVHIKTRTKQRELPTEINTEARLQKHEHTT